MKQITNFWNWFQDNEEAIKNAFILGINNKEVLYHLDRNYKYISNKIGFLIIGPSENKDKHTIIFTAYGSRKLFSKIVALEERAPKLQYFIPQGFIKPIQDISTYKNGIDKAFIFKNYKIKLSQLQMALIDYNCITKQLKIKLFIPNYDALKHFEGLEMNIKLIVMQVVGEIAFREHIKHIELKQLPAKTNGLLGLIELPEYIEYLYKINSKQKTKLI